MTVELRVLLQTQRAIKEAGSTRNPISKAKKAAREEYMKNI